MNKELKQVELAKYILWLAKNPERNLLDQVKYSQRIIPLRNLYRLKEPK
jgi:hypothetical protein